MKNDGLANYYRMLPEGFREDYRIDAKKTSVGVILNVVCLVFTVVAVAVCYLCKFGLTFPFSLDYTSLLALFVWAVATIVYLVLHELTHGLAYKAMTGQKLTFGLTFTVAYCGLKEGYVNKKTALVAVLAPLVAHGIWMIALICALPATVWNAVVILLFGIHFGGCVGDMYVALVLTFRYRGKQVLMRDDGPVQIFFLFDPNASTAEEQTEREEGCFAFGQAYARNAAAEAEPQISAETENQNRKDGE